MAAAISRFIPSPLMAGEHYELLLNPAFGRPADTAPAGSDGVAAAPDQRAAGAAFARAQASISQWPGYAVTPLVSLPQLAQSLGIASLHYKDENERFGLGSFKALGGAYAVACLLSAELAAHAGMAEPPVSHLFDGRYADRIAGITVCCATDGNHGRSVAWGARLFGARCVIFIHAGVSAGRAAAIAAYGAEIVRTEGNYDDSVREAQRQADANGWFVISDTSWPGYTRVPDDVMCGYELMAEEARCALAQPPTHLFLQTGVGGMAAAVVRRFQDADGERMPAVILADPARAACWLESLRDGRPVAVDGELDTLMAGLACGEVSLIAWPVLQSQARAVISVPDTDAVAVMQLLAQPSRQQPALVAGESAVAGLAALMAMAGDRQAREAIGLDGQSRVLVFGTEGATDPALYSELVGLSAEQVRARASGA